MNSQGSLLMGGAADATPLVDNYTKTRIMRSDFPQDFIFGSATSAYQVEGAWATDGKGPSNWDVFTQRTPDKIDGASNGTIAIDHYNLVKEDVALMKKIGLDSYRFSISWSRVLPGGRLSRGVNREGIKYYNYLIDLLLAEGIEPCATIFHWDVPQSLEDEYGGFLSPQIVKDYSEFAELCFWEFGDRVKYWITLNEPWSFTRNGYVLGAFPPGRGATSAATSNTLHRCRPTRAESVSTTCSNGSLGTEPYIVAHNLILAHATVVDIYRQRYKEHQGGQIGITNVATWFEPLTDTQPDKDAASRALDFMLGWFVAPVVTGDYPPVMRELVKNRLPTFTPEETKLVKGSYDFLGINYYTAYYATNAPNPPGAPPSYETDQQVKTSGEDGHGNPIGPQAGSDWLYIVPYGIHKLLIHIKEKYNNPPIYITENGVDEKNNIALTISESRIDEMRTKYHQDHLLYIKKAMDEGVDVKAYYIWSLFDNFEWAEGYSVRFGIIFVNFLNGQLTRTPKISAIWFMNFLNKKTIRLKRKAQENGEECGYVKKLRGT